MKKQTLLSLTIFALLFGKVSQPNASITHYSTGDFTPSEWSSHVHGISNPVYTGGVGSGSASTQLSGGNPDAYRRVSLTVAPFQAVINEQLWNVAVFTPLTQGAVNSVSLSYDITRVFTSDPGAREVTRGIALEQDGIIYRAFGGNFSAYPPFWEHFSMSNIVPLFPLVDWVNGGQITFGFYDLSAAYDVGFTTDGGYDNFAVTIDSVPVPAAAWLFGSAMAGLMGFRHRRNPSRRMR